MKTAKVIGNIWATRKDERLEGLKLLIVQPINLLDDEALRSCEKLAIVLGTEGEGLSQATIDASDYTVKIPMAHDVDSLNVAAASAVAFWELRVR